MNKITSFVTGLFFVCQCQAQNISGIINDYAAVTQIAGSSVAVSSGTAFSAGDRLLLIQMKGAMVNLSNTPNFGDTLGMGGAGVFEFLDISAVNGNTLSLLTSPTHTYNSDSGYVQVVRVPRFCTPVVTASLSCPAWDRNSGQGGIIVFEAGTLTINSSINANAKGFSGGAYASSLFGCDAGIWFGVQGDDGGQKGEGVSDYIPFYDGAKGKQANGGGGANSGNSGGGGGANAGGGGLGGHQYSGCNSAMDERGVGGLALNVGTTRMFLGGGGGGGYQDNSLTSSNGANGGGIIYIRANAIVSNSGTITATGGNVTVIAQDEASGGGGAGGTIFMECPNVTGNLVVRTDGGFGGSNNNISFPGDCHGTGGGGGGGVFAHSGAAMPGGIVYTTPGGAAGTVNNVNSSCYATTNGATAGNNGSSFPGLPTATLSLVVPNLTLTPSFIMCKGETATLTAGGASNYNWNTGATSSTLVVTPTVMTSYTVTATGSGTNSCLISAKVTVTVSACVGFDHLVAEEALKMYPNPAKQNVIFETQKTISIQICDELGRVIISQTFEKGIHQVDISRYPAGIYLVKAQDENGASRRKLVKTD